MFQTSAEKGLVLLTKAFFEAQFDVKDPELSAQILSLMHAHTEQHGMTMDDLNAAIRAAGRIPAADIKEDVPAEKVEIDPEEEALLRLLLYASNVETSTGYQRGEPHSIHDPKNPCGHKKTRHPRLDELDGAVWGPAHTPGSPQKTQSPLLIGGRLVFANP